MSTTATIYTLVAAPCQAESLLGPEVTWFASNATQDRLLDDYFVTACHEPPLPEIESIAASTEEPINAFLRARGFTIQIKINRPFLLWIERPGYHYPLFVGHITEEQWRDPQRNA